MEGDNMANREHLAILAKGVDVWRRWREQNPDIMPDISRTNLSQANLIDVNLSRANLVNVNLSEARIHKANLKGSLLMDANFTLADLRGADLRDAHLQGACFAWANLREADFRKTDLCDMSLCTADLTRANLHGVTVCRANLTGANLSGANLQHVDARFSQLCRCNLSGAKLTGAKLYATARDDWVINDVECRYVFWDAKGEIRSPKDRDLAPAEFEQIYKALPTIEYVFQNGMTPMDLLIMDRVVQAIRQQSPGYDIKIDSISARGLAPSIKFTVQQEEYKDPALAEVTRVYEAKVHELAGRLDEARCFIQRLIDRPGSVSIVNATGQYLAIGGSTINIDQHVEYITNLRDAVAALPEDGPTFAKTTKKTALDIIGSALKDVAKGQVKEAAKQIYELGKDLGPVIVSTAAYGFFKSCLGL